ncbi:MAG: LysM peptidoglycan-binding domain-containing protein [Candidatus Riflebacteria bacterium]|nr:LysM peptidoglycan-binding domain-containing protein [Candidatus Riflebacteria bacterium]
MFRQKLMVFLFFILRLGTPFFVFAGPFDGQIVTPHGSIPAAKALPENSTQLNSSTVCTPVDPIKPQSTIKITVKRGDTLWGLAQKYLGDGSKFNEIVKANVSKYPSLLKNPNLIIDGWILAVPDESKLGSMTNPYAWKPPTLSPTGTNSNIGKPASASSGLIAKNPTTKIPSAPIRAVENQPVPTRPAPSPAPPRPVLSPVPTRPVPSQPAPPRPLPPRPAPQPQPSGGVNNTSVLTRSNLLGIPLKTGHLQISFLFISKQGSIDVCERDRFQATVDGMSVNVVRDPNNPSRGILTFSGNTAQYPNLQRQPIGATIRTDGTSAQIVGDNGMSVKIVFQSDGSFQISGSVLPVTVSAHYVS